jgi:hypothetical protein
LALLDRYTPVTVPANNTIVPFGATVTLQVTQAGQNAAMVFGWHKTAGGPGLTLANAQAMAFKAWNLVHQCTVESTVLQQTVVRLTDGTDVTFYIPAGVTAATIQATGTQGSATAIAAAGVLFKWATANGSRSGKGRNFVPGLPASWAPDGRTINSAAQALIQSDIDAYLAASSTTGDWVPAVLSRKNAAAYPILAGSVGPVVGIQRRRMRG